MILGGCLVALVAGSPARAQEVGYTASMSVARETFDTERLTSIYVFNSVDVSGGPVRLWLSVPFIHQRLGLVDAALDTPDETSTGFGDPLIRVDVRIADDRERGLQIGLAGSVKPSIVDPEGGLGTGEADVGFGGTVFKTAGRTSLFGDLLFWRYGDPEGVAYRDSLSYSVGVGRVLGRGRWSAMASLSGFSHGLEGASPPMQLYLTMLTLAGRGQSLAITVGIGLNDDSGDFSLGTSWRIARW